MSDDRKDLPPTSAPNFNERLRETISTYLGNRGNKLDRGLTLRDLVDANIIKLRNGYLAGSGGSPVAGPGTAIPRVSEVDLTPPPTPTGFKADAAISNIFIEHDAPLYRQGHGHAKTVVYGVTWTTGPKPTFDKAVQITEFTGTIFAHPTNPATTWHLWIKWVTVDGVASASPAGGTNGVVVTTGQDVQLLLDALNGELTQSQLNTALGQRINLIDGTGAGSVTARVAAESTTRSNETGVLFGQYTVKVDLNGYVAGYGLASTVKDGVPTSEFIIRADNFAIAPVNTDAAAADGSPFFYRTTPSYINGTYIPAGGYMKAAFIHDATITNAKIANLAVDDAKIANLSVSKLTAGSISVGQYIQSATYISGVQGWRINGDGNAELSNAVVRGTVYATNGTFAGELKAATGTFSGNISAATGTFTGNIHGGQFTTGAYTGYNWPAAGNYGTYLGPFGLLIGNANNGKYLQLTSDGNIYTPGFDVVNGVMTVKQANVINTLNIAGNAVTVPFFGSQGGSGYGGTACWTQGQWLTAGSALIVTGTYTVYHPGFHGANITLYVNGQAVAGTGFSFENYGNGVCAGSYMVNYDGWYTVSAVVNGESGGTCTGCFLTGLGAKR